MQTTLYLIRHGESEANAADVFIGQTDLDLTPIGRKQGELTAAYLENITPDAIYSSDLCRAYNTAKITADKKGMQVIKRQGLREIYAGDWENRSFTQIKQDYPEEFKRWMWDTGNAYCVGGESTAQLMQRVKTELTELAQKHPGGIIFVFCHVTPIRALAASCLEAPLDGMKDIPRPSNASVTKATYDGNRFYIEEYSRNDFMGTLVTYVNLPEGE